MQTWQDIFDYTTDTLNIQWLDHRHSTHQPLGYLSCHQCQAELVVIDVIRRPSMIGHHRDALFPATLRNW
jgi:hypothetical protein